VREANYDGASVLLSSHVVREVETLADRVAILRRGRLVATVDITELRQRARQRLELHIDGPADATPFAELSPVIECYAAGTVIHLLVEGSVDPVIKVAGSMPVRRIVTDDADLEDVFLAYYRDPT
jgi:ABC-2 type transport system ATP-binding protein